MIVPTFINQAIALQFQDFKKIVFQSMELNKLSENCHPE